MGELENKLSGAPIWTGLEYPRMAPDPEKDARTAAEQASRIRRLNAQAEALREKADMACPESVKAFGRLHNIPTFAEFTWCDGFAAGYAAGLVRLRDRATASEEQDNG